MVCAAIDEIAAASPNLERLRACGAGALPLIADEWCFPGGDYIFDALEAIESSRRLWKATIKSLGHSLAAAELVVGAVEDYREHRRDPEAWKTHREGIGNGHPHAMLAALSREQRELRARDRTEAWGRLLRIVLSTS
jgi:hypothetical protein